MHDFKTYSSAEQNPTASKAFIKTLSPYELLQIIDNSSENNRDDFDARNYIIDSDSVIDGIIESGCEGKLLIVAARSNLGSRNEKLINLIFSKGNSFQSSLLSNPRISWYNFFAFDRSEFIDKHLDFIIGGESNLAPIFYRNPRMDRKLISHIIRGKKSEFWNSKYDFSKITNQQRIHAAYYSLPVKEIETNYDDIDDSFMFPSSNTTDFCKPIEASVFLIKSLSYQMSHNDLSHRLSCLKQIICDMIFSYDPKDWLTEAENMQTNESGDFHSAQEKAMHLAFGRIFVFFDELTTNIKLSVQGHATVSSYYTLAFISIVILSSLLRNYQNRSNFNENTSIFLKSNNWVIRAAAYSALLSNIPINEKGWKEFTNFLDHAKEDPEASTHGIRMSLAYYLFKNLHDEVPFNHAGIHLDNHFNKLKIPDNMNKYFDEISYMFDKYRDKTDLSKFIEEHNRHVILIAKKEERQTNFLNKMKNRFGF